MKHFIITGFLFFFSLMAYSQDWLWAKSSKGTGSGEGYSVSTDANGNVFVTGWFSSPAITFDSFTLTNASLGSDTSDIFIVKYDSSGNVLWAKRAGGTGRERALSITTDASGNVFVTGFFNSPVITFDTIILIGGGGGCTPFPCSNIFIVKYDTNGNALWAKSAGGIYSHNDVAQSVSTDKKGNVFITGRFGSPTITFGSITLTNNSNFGGCNIFLVKYSTNGNILWAKSAGGNASEHGYGVSTDNNGNVFVAGYYTSSTFTFGPATLVNAGNQDIYIAKYDTAGNVLWVKNAVGTGWDAGLSVSVDPTGNAFLTGYFDSPAITFGSVTITNKGGTCSPIPCEDAFITKYDANGNVLWAKGVGGNSKDVGNSVSSDVSGNAYLIGYFASSFVAFGSTTLTSAGGDNLFIAKYDSSGNDLCVSALANKGNAYIEGISADPFGNAYIASSFSTSPFIVGSNALSLTGLKNIFAAKFNCSCGNSTVMITGNANICSGQTTVLTAWGGTYSWSNGSTTNQISVAPTSTSTYSVVVLIGNCYDTGNITVTVSSPIAASISGNTTICSGQSSTLIASGGTSYLWNNSSTSSYIIVSPTSTSAYSVVASAGGCSDAASMTVAVFSLPTVIISGNDTICSGQNATLTASGGGTYLWSNGETGNSIFISPTITNNYSVIVTEINGCIDSSSATIIVTPTPIASISPDVTICEGNAVVMVAGGGVNYLWNTGATNSSIQIIPIVSSNYSVIVANGNCTDSASVFVVVNPNPLATISGNTSIYEGQAATLTVSGGVTYSWSSGETNATITMVPVIATIYCVIISDANNCKDTACIMIEVKSPCDTAGKFYFPNAFSPNNDGENDFLKIYYGNIDCIESLRLIIYNRWGEKIYETIDSNFQWDGIYNEKIVDTEVLMYNLYVKYYDDKVLNRKGNITLIR